MELTTLIEQICGYIALVTTMVGLIPQIYKAYRTKSTTDVSCIMLWNSLVCSVSWMIYGLLTCSKFIIWSNVLGTITSIVSLLQKRYYDAKQSQKVHKD